ncbi:MAG: hypothetical protein US68_C0006G0060 [Candidatus Shapirobacteria bacterium GW2011_GWE1_38_10]|uniref:Uncharacterized protein n=1 Tax=Candidatus Shapirobacteria bacterium GW2011_GWE1_38_10 TaxID=1618488 RepID=A0A0G0IHA0_9BACT|nr:MAG: hypothetical protein US46_C0002G0119 [Candidatus Shapirobacteria bacterium GW2011_GWF2_37_20]KKQ50380.1 MAG: hypothetical protein US68_C0006G0060 [Candidatus Shapirobacteria bacterium GW2011_GWE1_38_10]KKQ65204.1 MAG: hypothetical protein US85_C0001G0131 [Candidatus Shapirobacteria bacterium GW2011_GWF1_38_23]
MPKGVEVQVLLAAPENVFLKNDAPSSNGRTAAFGAVYCGSNPCGATKLLKLKK